MKKEYEATNYKSGLTDEQWEVIKEFFPSENKAIDLQYKCNTKKE